MADAILRAGNVGRPGLELGRQHGPAGALERQRTDYVATALVRRHGLEQRGLAVKNADAGRLRAPRVRSHIESQSSDWTSTSKGATA